MNNVTMIGRLTRDPETRQTTNGNKFSRYTIAVDKHGKGTNFFRCVTWDKGADFAEKYLHKGTKIAISGELEQDTYEKPNGEKIERIDIKVNYHEFVEPKRAETPEDFTDPFVEVPEEVPFV